MSYINIFYTGFTKLGVELTKSSFNTAFGIFKDLFKSYPATKIAFTEPNIKVLDF